jgi:hypothetical protein
MISIEWMGSKFSEVDDSINLAMTEATKDRSLSRSHRPMDGG